MRSVQRVVVVKDVEGNERLEVYCIQQWDTLQELTLALGGATIVNVVNKWKEKEEKAYAKFQLQQKLRQESRDEREAATAS